MTKTATALSSKTGLDYVVKPLHYGISSGVSHMSSGVGHVSSVAGTMTSHVISMPSEMLRRASMDIHRHDALRDPEGDEGRAEMKHRRRGSNGADFSRYSLNSEKAKWQGSNGTNCAGPMRRGSNGTEICRENIDSATGSDIFRHSCKASKPQRRGSSGADFSRQLSDSNLPTISASNYVDYDDYYLGSDKESRNTGISADFAPSRSGAYEPRSRETNSNDLAQKFAGPHGTEKSTSPDLASNRGALYEQWQQDTQLLAPLYAEATQRSAQSATCEQVECECDTSVDLDKRLRSGASDVSGQSELIPFPDGEPNDFKHDIGSERDTEEIDPALIFPEQNIDVQGPSTGKRLTDDLAEIKDKMHELTWHLFDDHTYVIKKPDALFFGESVKPSKRKKSDPSKKLDKYLHMGQYSHSNPFVARVGMYVEPIIGSTYSILCLFRAGFNITTWQDPMLTFWVSLVCGILSLILFFFPWRIFLFIVGVVLVGPQNWVIRILREQGRLPPAPKYRSKKGDSSAANHENISEIPTDKPVFTKECRMSGNGPRKPIDPSVDPREIHHVVVPYSALCHQRCNDWPPEPQYACVEPKDDANDERFLARTSKFRRPASVGSEHSNFGVPISRLGRLRRRLRGKRINQ